MAQLLAWLDVSLLGMRQASRWGINNHSVQGSGQHQARGFPKIEQMCTEVQRDLMSRHVQILKEGA